MHAHLGLAPALVRGRPARSGAPWRRNGGRTRAAHGDRAIVRSRRGLVAAAMVAACAPPAAPPNIVLIYADDLGWRDLGVMGSTYYDTPHVDALARDGMRFTNAYANAPNCAPSRASLLTGLYAPRHGVYTVGAAARGDARHRRLVPADNETALDHDLVTFAEALRAAGYATAHVGKWHLGGEGSSPADHGFDVTIGGDAGGSPPGYFFPYRRDGRQLPRLERGTTGEYLTDRLTREAVAFLAEQRDGPFLLYLSHYAVHTPIQAKDDDIGHFRDRPPSGGHGNPAYAAMVKALDDGVGGILHALDELDIADNTVVLFLSDNGGYGPVTSMAPLRGSKGTLYEGGIRVPFIVRWPGRVGAGSVSHAPVIGTDLFPTLLDLAGVTPPGSQPPDGVSLAPLLLGEGALSPRPLVWHFPAYLEADPSVPGPWRTTPAAALRMGDYKLVHFFEDEAWELYDLAADTGETVDLARDLPEETAALRAMLVSWWRETGAWIPTEPNPFYEPPGDAR